MMYVPPPQATQIDIEYERRIKEDELKRQLSLTPLDAPARDELPRQVVILIRLMVAVLIIVAAVVLYHLVF